MRCSLRLLTLLALGCGSTPAKSTVTSAPALAPTAAAAGTLSAESPYAALVQSAAQREARADPARACLLESGEGGYRLGAEIVSAVRPLPSPHEDLDDALKQAERVEILSSWGRHGDGTAKLAIAGFTVAPPTRSALALFLTDRGLSLRGASGSPFPPRDDLTLAQVLELLAAQTSTTVFLAAEANVALGQLQSVLSGLHGRGAQVVLAVNLAPDTALPLPVNATARAALCPDGLPETEALEGSLPMAQLTAAVAPLRERAADCLLRGDARGAAGGRLVLAMRVDATGQIQEACVTRDELGDPGVAACVIDLARRLSFGPPAPAGVLDIELPLALVPGTSAVQPLVCTP